MYQMVRPVPSSAPIHTASGSTTRPQNASRGLFHTATKTSATITRLSLATTETADGRQLSLHRRESDYFIYLDGEELKLGLLELPSFYGDRDPSKRQGSRDVARLLKEMKEFRSAK